MAKRFVPQEDANDPIHLASYENMDVDVSYIAIGWSNHICSHAGWSHMSALIPFSSL